VDDCLKAVEHGYLGLNGVLIVCNKDKKRGYREEQKEEKEYVL
jgi:hypothetical protein